MHDPTLPRVKIECPECGGEEACYMASSDEGQSFIEVQLICTNAGRCDKVWTLPTYQKIHNFNIVENIHMRWFLFLLSLIKISILTF